MNIRVRGGSFSGAVLLASLSLAAVEVTASAVAAQEVVQQDPVVRVQPLQPAAGTAWVPARSLTVQVQLVHPADVDDAAPTAPLTLAPASMPWPSSVTLRAYAGDGTELAWSFVRSVGHGDKPRTLRRGNPIALLFVLAAEPGRTFAAPSCTLRAELAIADGNGWRGRSASAPVAVAVAAAAPPPAGTLDLKLVAAPVLSPGEAWVVAIELPPPVVSRRDDDLRAGYVLRWRDAAGKELPLVPAFVATPPTLPNARDLRERGFGPVFAVFAPAVTKDLPPGQYSLEVEHRAGDLRSRGELSCRTVPAGDADVRLPGPLSGPVALAPGQRDAARLEVHLAHAQALLWHAEFGDAAHVERTATAAAAVLRAAEQLALAKHSFAALAEIYLRMGDVDAAGAFARVALGLWTPPPAPADAGPVAAAPEELRSLLDAVERGAPPASVRVMPYLRAALAASAVGEPGTSTTPTPGTPANEAPAANGVLRQWARSARASSEYRTTDYAAAQATGAPNVAKAGDSGKAWAPKLADGGGEWLEVTFAQAVHATELRVVQSHAPGAIVRIDAIGADGAAVAVWTGPDATNYPPRTIGVLTATLAAGTAPVATFRIVLDSKRIADWNEIDAVELIGRRD